MTAEFGHLDPETMGDAIRDALALLRSVHAQDYRGSSVVMENLTDPPGTALCLALMLDAHMDAYGDRITVLNRWQQEAGL
jgi:hypothetical protein